MIIHNNVSEPWKVTLVDTGLNTMTGGRIKRVQKYIGDEPFMMTYGDGVSDININELVQFHQFWTLIVRVKALLRFEKNPLRTAAGSVRDLWCWSRKYLTI